MKNKYVIRSKISEIKFRQIIKYFSLDLQASQITELTGLNRNSINSYINAIRNAIMNQTENKTIDNSNEYQFFGLLKRNDKVYVQPISKKQYLDIKNYQNEEIGKLEKNRMVLHGILDFINQKYYSIHHETTNDTAPFWGYAKMRLAKFRGIPTKSIYLHLKECEFRYNNRNTDLYKLMLKLFRQTPLNL